MNHIPMGNPGWLMGILIYGLLYLAYLAGGWTNPFEKYARQNGFIFPNFRGENKNVFELPPPSYNPSLTG